MRDRLSQLSDIGLFMCTNMLRLSCYLCINFDQAKVKHSVWLKVPFISREVTLHDEEGVGLGIRTAFYHRHEWEPPHRYCRGKRNYWSWGTDKLEWVAAFAESTGSILARGRKIWDWSKMIWKLNLRYKECDLESAI